MSRTFDFTKKRIRVLFIILTALILIALPEFSAYAGIVPPADYKKTELLTDSDMADPYQKNYQLYPDSDDDDFMYKFAEWTDQDAGAARIKVVTGTKEALDTTAVYVFTDCDQHGFSKDLAEANVKYLLDHYDRVDIVVTDSQYPSGIKTYLDVKNTNFLQEVGFSPNKHFNMLVYEGLYDYLTDTVPGSEAGAETLKRFPDAMYTSFDSRITVTPGDGNISSDLLKKMDIGTLLKKYDDEGRYFSLCACGGGDTKSMCVWGGYNGKNLPDYTTAMTASNRLRANLLALLMDPQTWTDMDTAEKQLWDGSTGLSLPDKADCPGIKFAPFPTDYHILNGNTPVQGDYLYSESLAALNIPVPYVLTVTDTVNEIFEIKNVTCSDQSAEVNTNGNTVDVKTRNYDPASPLEITIDVQLKDTTSEQYKNCWLNTNADAAITKSTVKGELKQLLSVDSPKLARLSKYNVTYVVDGDPTYGTPTDGTAPIDDRNPYHYKEDVTVKDNLTTSWTTSDGTPNGTPGKWVFTPWDKSDFQNTEDTEIRGAWKFTPDPAPDPTPKTGDLTVSKTVSGNAGDRTRAFRFTTTMKDASINGQYGDLYFKKGVASFELKHGESVTAKDLPAGTAFTVSEKDSRGYKVTVNKSEGNTLSGTIAVGREAKAAFNNRRTKHRPGGDTPNDPPVRTGDASGIPGWTALMLLSLAAIIGLLKHGRRGNRE